MSAGAREPIDDLTDALHAMLMGHDLDDIFVVLACALGIAMSEIAERDEALHQELREELLEIVDRRWAKDKQQ